MKEANMKLLQNTLANLIRSGKVTVDIPGLDMDQLTQFLYSESAQTIRDIASVAYDDDLSPADKIYIIQNRLPPF